MRKLGSDAQARRVICANCGDQASHHMSDGTCLFNSTTFSAQVGDFVSFPGFKKGFQCRKCNHLRGSHGPNATCLAEER